MSGQGFYGFPNILGLLRATNLHVLGKAGATAGAGLAGGTTSGAPTSGSFDVGDGVFGQDGSLWICSVAGSPGTFVQAGFANPLSTKADVLVGGTAGTPSRLGVGSDNQVLTADSTQTLGLKWAVTAANAGGALTQIAQTVLGASAASVTFSSIPGSYTHLLLVTSTRDTSSNTADGLTLQFNGDTAANYDWQQVQGSSSAASAANSAATTSLNIGDVTSSNVTAGYFAASETMIVDYTSTAKHKVTISRQFRADSTSIFVATLRCGRWRTTNAAVTSMLIFPGAGSFAASSSFTLYGLS